MRTRALLGGGCVCLLILGLGVVGRSRIWARSGDNAPAMTAAPVAAVKPVTEEFFGKEVTDPYRWLEDLKNPEVQKWFKGQDDYTRGVLAKILGRAALLKRIEEVDQSAPFRVFDVQRLAGEKYFYQKRMANEDVAKLYVREGLDGKEKLLVDPNQYVKEAGTHYSFDYYVPSLDGRYVAYGVSPSGSEDAAIRVMDVTTGKETGESISRSWNGGITWLPDNQSFVHIRFQELKPGMDPAERRLKSRVWLHSVGMDAEKDTPVFGWEVDAKIPLDPVDTSVVGVDPRSPHTLACVSHGFDNDLTCYAAATEAVSRGNASWQKLFDRQDGIINVDVRNCGVAGDGRSSKGGGGTAEAGGAAVCRARCGGGGRTLPGCFGFCDPWIFRAASRVFRSCGAMQSKSNSGKPMRARVPYAIPYGARAGWMPISG